MLKAEPVFTTELGRAIWMLGPLNCLFCECLICVCLFKRFKAKINYAMCILLPHNLIRTSNSIFFVPFTDCPPRPCPPWQLLDVLRGFPHLQRHLCYLQQPRQSLRSDGKAALRPYILPHLPAHTSCGSSTQV